MNSSYKEIWNIILASLSEKCPEAMMTLWFNKFELAFLDETSAVLVTDESKDLIDLLNTRYSEKIAKCFKEKLDLDVKVEIFDKTTYSLESEHQKIKQRSDEKDEIVSASGEEADQAAETEFEKQPQKKQTEDPDSIYTFENFVVGNSNKFAHGASLAIAKNPRANENNPLFIYGESGLGKTHLMKAIANYVAKEYPSYKTIFVSGENFTNEFIDSLSTKTMAKFREKYRSADILFIDDIQFIAGRTSTEEEFFHTFNELRDHNRQIVLTSDRLPQEIPSLQSRLISRFEGGLVVDIQPPDTELKIAIFKRKAEMMNIPISLEVLTYIAENTKSNVRQIEGIIKRLGAYSYINGVPITVETAKSVLSGILSVNVPPSVVAEKIIERVSQFYNIPVEDIKSKRRNQEIAQARHVSIYIINNVTTLTLENIGKIFGRDHSTVLSSVHVVMAQMKNDVSFEHDINLIIKEFK